MPKVTRGEIWLVDFSPQSYKEEPGKNSRPSLVIQTDILNHHGHKTTIVVPGTTDVYQDQDGTGFPLRVNIGQITGKNTDLMIDLIRAISNDRFMGQSPVATIGINHMRQVEAALKKLTEI